VVRRRRPYKDPRPFLIEGQGIDTCVIESECSGLKKEPLLGVHLLGFPGGQAKITGIEVKDIGNKTGVPRIALARRLAVWIVVVQQPSAPRRNFGNLAPLVNEVVPDFGGVLCTGKPTRVSDHGHAVGVFADCAPHQPFFFHQSRESHPGICGSPFSCFIAGAWFPHRRGPYRSEHEKNSKGKMPALSFVNFARQDKDVYEEFGYAVEFAGLSCGAAPST